MSESLDGSVYSGDETDERNERSVEKFEKYFQTLLLVRSDGQLEHGRCHRSARFDKPTVTYRWVWNDTGKPESTLTNSPLATSGAFKLASSGTCQFDP